MARIARTFLLLALMLTASYGISAAASDTTDAGADARSVTARTLDRLPESGTLLLWGTGLAAASRLLSRKRNGSED